MDNEKEIRPWKILGSEYLFRRPWLTARRDHVQLPNGAENEEFYVLEYPDWVNVIALTTTGKFVFIRQYRHAIGEIHPELCAGVIDPTDASPLEAARRELYEETGYGGGHWEEFCVLAPNPSSQTNRTYTFLATDVEPLSTQHLEATEDISVHLLTPSEVYRLLAGGDIIQALMAAPLWRYFCLNGIPAADNPAED